MTQLPNAPLTEVVFELRWRLKEDPAIPPVFWSDPGYSLAADSFIAEAERHGFQYAKKMGADAQITAHSIGYRFYKSADQSFPLWQIGPGIFAANQSAAYEWKSYKKLVIDGTKALLRAYPKLKALPLNFTQMELRYIDSFDSRYLEGEDVLRFINEQTSLRVDIPAFFMQKPLSGPANANLAFEFPVTDQKDTSFLVRVANAKANDQNTVLLESKIITRADRIALGSTPAQITKQLSAWLDSAHRITSPFFKQFVGESLMQRFAARADNAK